MALVSVVFAPPVPYRAAALALVVLVFAALRHRLGNAMQRRFFMAVDFTEVSVRRVQPVRPDVVERGPVHLVQTTVRVDTRMTAGSAVSGRVEDAAHQDA